MKALAMVVSMLAVGLLVWRALERQEARRKATDDAGGASTDTD